MVARTDVAFGILKDAQRKQQKNRSFILVSFYFRFKKCQKEMWLNEREWEGETRRERFVSFVAPSLQTRMDELGSNSSIQKPDNILLFFKFFLLLSLVCLFVFCFFENLPEIVSYSTSMIWPFFFFDKSQILFNQGITGSQSNSSSVLLRDHNQSF